MTEDPALEDLRYPIGRMPIVEEHVDPERRAAWIGDIESLPRRLRAVVGGFSPAQWDTPYRPGAL